MHTVLLKEVFRSNLGKKVVKAMIWGAVGIAIAAAGNGLLILIMETGNLNDIPTEFVFLFGVFYCLLFASFYVLLGAVITLLVMIIIKYTKRSNV